MRADRHVQTPPARDDDLGDTGSIRASVLPPQADGRASHAHIEVAVDDGYDEASGTYDLRRRWLAANRGDLRAAELALRRAGSTAGGDQPDEEQCDP